MFVMLNEGTDVTELLGVQLYDIPVPACLSGKVKGRLPVFVPKTDETRVQLLIDILKTYEGEECYITEKLDGASVSIFLVNGQFGVCSRNLELLETEGNSIWSVIREMDVENKLRVLGRNLVLQGEIVGPGIQENKLKLNTHHIFYFNVIDADIHRYLSYNEFVDTIGKLGLQVVPLVECNWKLISDIPSLVQKATRRSIFSQDIWAEGIVIRPIEEKHTVCNELPHGRLSFKVINPEFLLQYGG